MPNDENDLMLIQQELDRLASVFGERAVKIACKRYLTDPNE